jgi:hypothetical protein
MPRRRRSPGVALEHTLSGRAAYQNEGKSGSQEATVSRSKRPRKSWKQGLGGTHMDSNQRLMYTWAWASPQKCRAVGLLAAVKSHLMTASCCSPHSITNQWTGFSLTVPQISHWNSFRLDMPSRLRERWLGKGQYSGKKRRCPPCCPSRRLRPNHRLLISNGRQQ